MRVLQTFAATVGPEAKGACGGLVWAAAVHAVSYIHPQVGKDASMSDVIEMH